MTFDDLLHLDAAAEVVAGPAVCALVIGPSAAPAADALAAGSNMRRAGSAARIVFGLPIHTAPFPVLISSMNTERGTRLDQLSLFGWIEDHFIEEPRAEVFGLTPYGEAPVVFLRDFDLDRSPEAYVVLSNPPPGGGPERLFRRVGMIVLTGADAPSGEDAAALAALEAALPASAQAFIDGLRADVARGQPLRQVLRARRKTTAPALMAQCDGWRVLTRAARLTTSPSASPP